MGKFIDANELKKEDFLICLYKTFENIQASIEQQICFFQSRFK